MHNCKYVLLLEVTSHNWNLITEYPHLQSRIIVKSRNFINCCQKTHILLYHLDNEHQKWITVMELGCAFAETLEEIN